MIEVKIKYLNGATKLKAIEKGDWIDLLYQMMDGNIQRVT